MPFNYAIKGWPSPITLDSKSYTVSSCDKDDTGLCYSQAAAKNPHVTIHGINKEGPDDWWRADGPFHVRVSNTKLYEYNRFGSDDFATKGTKNKKAEATTGVGTADQTMEGNKIADEFRKIMELKITGK